MKRYFMICGLLPVLAIFSLPALSNETLSVEGATYRPVEVNGQRYYLKDSGARTRTKRSADSSAVSPSLYVGDTLRRDAAEPEFKINGGIFVKVDEQEVPGLAQRYGLATRHSIGGITLFEAAGSTDVNQIASKLQQEGYEVQIELTAPLLEPE